MHSDCPEGHSGSHLPPRHTRPPAQAVPQAPQCARVVFRSVSQPSPTVPLQFPKPVPQVNPQDPPTHVTEALALAGHTVPHPPQCAVLAVVFVSQPLPRSVSQSPKPAPQVKPHTPPVQPTEALARAGHTVPHPPQCAVLVRVSVSQPVPSIPSQLPKPVRHAKPQVPEAHVAEAFVRSGHTDRQALQCDVLVRRSVSQPLPGIPSQSPRPVVQVELHVPPVHVGVAPDTEGHALRHIPQWATAVRVSTSQPLLASPSQSEKFVLQVNPHAPATQVAVALLREGQARSQPPQCASAEVVSASQPLSTAPSQLPRPVLQVKPHAPIAQKRTALVRAGQTRPHSPQWSGSYAVPVHEPPQLVCPAGHAATHAPPAQDAPRPHVRPHPPQLSGSLPSPASQPSDASPLQLEYPSAQLTTVQAPPAHPAVAWGSTHARPQAPQFIGLVPSTASQPLALIPSQSP